MTQADSVPHSLELCSRLASVPYENCFVESTSSEGFDIAILGAPFDTAVTARPGARFGPKAIRAASVRKAYGYSLYTGEIVNARTTFKDLCHQSSFNPYQGRDPVRDWARVVDCSDAPLTFLDNRVALRTLDQAHRAVSGRTTAHPEKSTIPRIVTLGGDHTTTLSALRSTYKRWGPVSVVHFDSHIDTWDPKVLGMEALLQQRGLNHGTFLHIAHEENLILNSSIHAGIRAPVMRQKADMRNDRRCGFDTITAREIDTMGVQSIIDRIRERVGNSSTYISVDIDVLDPAFAPATGTPEPSGWSTRELTTILAGLEGLNIIGGDVVEVSPAYDDNGEITALAAVEVVHSILELMVATPVEAPRHE
ncbi:Arginase/agmatinase/formimionoglutamate hydrolase [Trichoderma reesei QM6a]|uniref:Arginase/agmatinase/formimionoglutamate hydrolase n=2 Tax=Hypocrea jecorina TaxID=51453 RepID=G0RKD3_HYPJQ|nr:Arginase/agmatinase/formimionoglutamate hydrolase [Trichoderma reesei QM6a]EGR48242.1 Arginase/agmatinase/formimionoglutamate hydrolase [Trichoderma reesei QM6a]ETS07051.1 Arginase/deacetylase [Trichoderma reesei RUT C-30]